MLLKIKLRIRQYILTFELPQNPALEQQCAFRSSGLQIAVSPLDIGGATLPHRPLLPSPASRVYLKMKNLEQLK
jgi:hypothetical protein